MTSIAPSRLFLSSGLAQAAIVPVLAADGFVVSPSDIPSSVVGKDDAVCGVHFYCNTDSLAVVVGLNDFVQVDRTTAHNEFCGFNWAVFNKVSGQHQKGGHIDDFHHSFGKGRAIEAMRNDLEKAGFADFDTLWDRFQAELKATKGERESLLKAVVGVEVAAS